MKSRLIFDAKNYEEIIKKSCKKFIYLESNSLADVNIEDCISDFSNCVLICHAYLIKQEAENDQR